MEGGAVSPALTAEEQELERQHAQVAVTPPTLPAGAELRRLASRAFDDLDRVMAGGTIEEKRGMISLYVKKIEAEPDRQTVQISLYPAILSRVIEGV